MFEAHRREALRQQICERARDDVRISSCALVGSAARGQEDRWSDIDVALQLDADSDLQQVAESWTDWFVADVGVADSLDIWSGGALYRVFLLADSMQVDLSFWPHTRFRSTGGPMAIVFGQANSPQPPAAPDADHVVGMGWLYALHTRSAVARGRLWQAEVMLARLREQVIAIASLRLRLDPAHARDAHRLPPTLTTRLGVSRATEVTSEELQRSLRDTIAVYQDEVTQYDPARALALRPALTALCQP